MADVDDLFDCFESTENNELVPIASTIDDEKVIPNTENLKSSEICKTVDTDVISENKR